MNFKRQKKESIQPVVKIDRALYLELKNWLKTDKAKRLGLNSTNHFITCASKKLMQKFKDGEKEYKNG